MLVAQHEVIKTNGPSTISAVLAVAFQETAGELSSFLAIESHF